MHRIFYLWPFAAVGMGYQLSVGIRAGETWVIILQSFACLFITAAIVLAYRCFYHMGKIDAYKDMTNERR